MNEESKYDNPDYSEFGRGLTYCLGLFMAHTQQERVKDKFQYSLFFSASTDHLYDLQIPEKLPNTLQNRIKKFRDKCLTIRSNFEATEKDFLWAVKEAKTLLMLIDESIGVKVNEGEYE